MIRIDSEKEDGVIEMPTVSERVRDLHARMTLEEKLAQLVGYWVDQGGEVVAPMQGEMAVSARYDEATEHGLGHLTRVYGTRPVDPVERAGWLWAEQRRLVEETRLGIPALVHEECLTGLAAWQAATFPTPLAWGASFDDELVQQTGAAIGASMTGLGVHQGLAPSSTSSATPGGAGSRSASARTPTWSAPSARRTSAGCSRRA